MEIIFEGQESSKVDYQESKEASRILYKGRGKVCKDA